MKKYELYSIISHIYIVGSVVTSDMIKTIALLIAALFYIALAVKED